MKKGILALCLILFLSASSVFCLGPKIDKHVAVWTANTESDLAGYYLYWRTSAGTFSDANRVVIPKSTTPTYELLTLNLPSGVYIIAVSAYNTAGNESALSTEVTWNATIPGAPKNPGIQ
jgi:hypothetical protein